MLEIELGSRAWSVSCTVTRQEYFRAPQIDPLQSLMVGKISGKIQILGDFHNASQLLTNQLASHSSKQISVR